jgi:hypothetical protein
MPNPLRALQRVLTERRALGRKELELLDRMIRSIASASAPHSGARANGRARKRLRCARCDRRFALPMHLGRHMAMSHRRRTAA